MKDFTLHIIRDDLLVLSLGDRIPASQCHEIREKLREGIPDDIDVLVFSYTEVVDHRPAPPLVLEAAETLQTWLESL